MLDRSNDKRKIQRQRERVYRGLEEAWERSRRGEKGTALVRADLDAARFIVFSDQHKGVRNRADDFRQSERAYNSALAYYFELGSTLIVLGDSEELWKEHPGQVLKAYRRTLNLEADFHRAGRYHRIWGNHDDQWSLPLVARWYLEPIFGPIEVLESLTIELTREGEPQGSIFLLHGHQGTSNSDRFTRISRIPVRYLWRPLQRLTGYSLNTPAKDWELREGHNLAMGSWAADQPGAFILIAGHTHRPVFKSNLLAAQIRDRLEEARRQLAARPENAESRSRVAQLAAQLEWTLAQDLQDPGGGAVRGPDRPSYFNTGCCCFLDGDITGIEIAEGEIRLVRWPDRDDRPVPEVLASVEIRTLLRECATPSLRTAGSLP